MANGRISVLKLKSSTAFQADQMPTYKESSEYPGNLMPTIIPIIHMVTMTVTSEESHTLGDGKLL